MKTLRLVCDTTARRQIKALPGDRQCPDLVGRCCRTAALPQQCATKSGRNRTTRWLDFGL